MPNTVSAQAAVRSKTRNGVSVRRSGGVCTQQTKQQMLKTLVCSDAPEQALRYRGARCIAGVDEVGRGALFGPVVAAAVILPEEIGVLAVAGPIAAGAYFYPNIERYMHVKWMAQELSKLSPEQIRDAFRAAGYSPEEVEGFAGVVEKRIAALREL